MCGERLGWLVAMGDEEDVVGKDTGGGPGLSCEECQRSHDEGDEDHGEGTALGDGGGFAVGLAEGSCYAVVDRYLFVV